MLDRWSNQSLNTMSSIHQTLYSINQKGADLQLSFLAFFADLASSSAALRFSVGFLTRFGRGGSSVTKAPGDSRTSSFMPGLADNLKTKRGCVARRSGVVGGLLGGGGIPPTSWSRTSDIDVTAWFSVTRGVSLRSSSPTSAVDVERGVSKYKTSGSCP